ncbi:class I SAM-dependent methyltransferase [Aliarcobacter skirrowii]|uniref:class I SAM-dependent methyltransferase n=1 Tax=Aliarcobacter skirrowii TaxID=28200 RepID=UPI0029BA2B1B|nr:class I SAM-dependent methyltransferase [Aliarcobacter skirrowii]MDX3960455.1 class I SAM-dependent methyltransferase [Aliarcobacter skirrowii]
MEFNYVANIVDKVPYISKTNANYIYDFIIENKIQNILELGIAHGTATCYMAAALNELGAGKITAVDLQSVAKDFKPSCEEQLKKCNLERYVEVHRMKTGYNWFLHNKIKENSINNKCEEEYDLCIIDGPKNWIIDSSAFFLVDKLLKLYNQIEKLKNNGNKFLIYGYGSMAKIIESLMPKQITGFIDLNYDKLNNEKVFSIENGLKKDFDFILISILGREEEVIDSLINEYSIQKDKIIKLI